MSDESEVRDDIPWPTIKWVAGFVVALALVASFVAGREGEPEPPEQEAAYECVRQVTLDLRAFIQGDMVTWTGEEAEDHIFLQAREVYVTSIQQSAPFITAITRSGVVISHGCADAYDAPNPTRVNMEMHRLERNVLRPLEGGDG